MKGIFSRLTQEDLDAKHRAWNALGLSKERQTELVRVFDLKSEPKPEPEPEPGMGDAPASERVSQPRASLPRPPKNISRRTRGSRITKSTAQIQSAANRSTRSRQTAPTLVKVSILNRRSKRQKASDIINKLENSTVQVLQQTRKKQFKVHKKRVFGAIGDIDDKVLQSKYYDTGQRVNRRLAYKSL
ncbi:hypothetical protein BDZ45DRAFT_691142 [Acephala macrosclerotiorum]|nr:hypothetical protein BDZ45DRAFT_691142 [Acephala macrosclerotiorum]